MPFTLLRDTSNVPVAGYDSDKDAIITVREYATAAFATSAARSSDGNSSASPIASSRFKEILCFINVSDVQSGSGNLSITIKSKDPVSAAWFVIGEVVVISQTGQHVLKIANCLGENIAAFWEIDSGSEFTFSIGGVLKS